MTTETTPDSAALNVLARVQRRQAVSNADKEAVLFLVRGGYMHSNPVHVASEVCPYQLTDAGRAALQQLRR